MNKFLYLLGTVLAFLFITYTTLVMSHNFVLEHDDAFVYYNANLSFFDNYIKDVYHGKYISNFLIKFITYALPLHFSIHPVNWFGTYGAFIKGICFFIFTYMMSSLIFSFKNKINICIPIISVLLYIFFIVHYFDNYQFELNCSFYSFVFIFIFFFMFWQKFIKLYCFEKNYKKSDYIWGGGFYHF